MTSNGCVWLWAVTNVAHFTSSMTCFGKMPARRYHSIMLIHDSIDMEAVASPQPLWSLILIFYMPPGFLRFPLPPVWLIPCRSHSARSATSSLSDFLLVSDSWSIIEKESIRSLSSSNLEFKDDVLETNDDSSESYTEWYSSSNEDMDWKSSSTKSKAPSYWPIVSFRIGL